MGRVLTTEDPQLSPENRHGLILYDAPASPCCRRCRITLLEKGLDWDTVNLNLGHMEQRTADYLEMNPNGFVPTLAHGDKIIFESGVINTYLECQFPDKPLMPADAAGTARVRMWQWSELAMAKIFRPVMYAITAGPIKRVTRSEEESELISRLATEDPYDLAWERKVYRLEVLNQDEIQQHLQWLMDWVIPVERALEKQDFLVNNAFSQADIAVYPRLEMYAGLGLEISAGQFPNAVRWMRNLEQRHSFIASESEAVKKYSAMTRSPEMRALRKYFATPVDQRTEEMEERVREFGASRRKILGVEELLANPKKVHPLPRPRALDPELEQQSVALPQGKKLGAVTVYGYRQSPHSERIEWLLRYLGKAYTFRNVNIAARENHSEAFLALNPLGEVPVLRVEFVEGGEITLSDSSAIAEFLCACLPGGERLYPAKSFELARHNMWLALEAGTHKEFTPLLREVVFADQPELCPTIDATYRSYLTERIREKLLLVNRCLEKTPYLTGETLAYSDIAWYGRIKHMLRTSLAASIGEFKAIERWQIRMEDCLDSRSGKHRDQ